MVIGGGDSLCQWRVVYSIEEETKKSRFQPNDVDEHSYKQSFHVYDDVNLDLTFGLKMVAVRVSPSVVAAIDVYSGEQQVFFGLGIILECQVAAADGAYVGTILSSATLITSPANRTQIANHLRVDVYL